MKKELNLVDILKDCPQGTKLYSIMHGEVEFKQIKYNTDYPIVFKYKGEDGIYYDDTTTIDGKFNLNSAGECTLFPTKDQRDWSKFNIEPEELFDGEIYYVKNDIVEWIYIYKKTYTFKTSHYVAVLNNYFNYYMEFNGICTTQNDDIKILRKATEEEKRLFFEIIEKNGRKWDADKKELVKIEPKFDISTLQPFDKVLVRNGNDHWTCTLFSNIVNIDDKKYKYFFKCINSMWTQCLPYNDETKYLIGTTEIPPKKYITWKE